MEIYVQAFPSGEKHRISTAGGANPAWARNGREIFYLARNNGSGKLALMATGFTPGGAFQVGAPHVLFEGVFVLTDMTRSYDVLRTVNTSSWKYRRGVRRPSP